MQVLVKTHYQFYFLVRLYYFSFFQKDKNHSANNYIKGHFFCFVLKGRGIHRMMCSMAIRFAIQILQFIFYFRMSRCSVYGIF